MARTLQATALVYGATIIAFCKSLLKHYHNVVLVSAKATRIALACLI